MSLSMLERIALLISCPYCEQGTQKPIAWLIKNAEMPCDYCGRTRSPTVIPYRAPALARVRPVA